MRRTRTRGATRRAAGPLACALAFALLGSGCAGTTPAGVPSAAGQEQAQSATRQAPGDSSEEKVARLLEVAEGEMGNTDGTRYEDALLEAGGELCYQRGYWCATYVWWSFREAGLAEYLCDGEMTVYPQRQAAYFEWEGRFHELPDDEWQPAPGDIAFFYYSDGFPGGEVVSHSEIVTSYDPEAGTFETLTGNPEVTRHEHSVYADDVRGFGDVDWEV